MQRQRIIRNNKVLAFLVAVLTFPLTTLSEPTSVNYSVIPKSLADTAVLLRERALLDNL